MIIFIHSLYFVLKFAIKLYKKRKALQNFIPIENGKTQNELEELDKFFEESLQFDPPVYRQRYAEVQQILLDKRWRHEIKKLVDFGCAELGFFIYLKHSFGINEILEVDFDFNVLENHKYKVQPLTADYLGRRSEPLKVNLLCGSIGDPDCRLCDVDAVVGIEIIEHLFPDALEALPFNIFGYINPRIAIFTTPNADFNVLFTNFKGFRHYDHKFEWSREQFQDWANNICARFPEYTVTFHGIGSGPKGTDSLGQCSQMAVFTREYTKIETEVPHENECHSRIIHPPEESSGICTYYSYTKQMKSLGDLADPDACDTVSPIVDNYYYKLVETVEFPFVKDNRTADEKILQEAVYIIYRNATYHSRYYNEDTDTVEIPLHELVHNFEGYFITVEEIRDILIKAEFDVKECCLDGSHPCVVYPVSMEKQSTPNSSVKSEQEYNVDLSHEVESDWDCEYQAKTKPEEENAESPVEPSEQLFDSGYQKSISNAEWSPTSPLDGTFEEHFNSFLKLDVNDIKENMKAHNRKELLLKRINNRVYSERRQMIAGTSSSRKSPEPPPQVAGSSNPEKKKKRKGAKGKAEDKDDDVVQDLRMLADCIVYNSLNMVHVEAVGVPEARIIEAPIIIAVPEGEVEGARYPAVENGDLANNNRDNEGNNYPDDVPIPMDLDLVADDENNANENMEIDNAGELEAQPALPFFEQQDQQNQNDIPNLMEVIPEPEPLPILDYEDDESEAALTIEDPIVLNHASREALFDPDSQLDMLEDYPEALQGARDVEPLQIPVVIRVDQITDENVDVGIPNDANPFPNWLLQLLGQQVEEDAGENHDEPHFYCQGDGLGVHPSIIEVDVDDSSSSDSSSNDEAEAEQTLSEEDVGPLPTDGNQEQAMGIEIVGQAIQLRASTSAVSNDSTEEFFDTVEEDTGCPGTNVKE